MREGYFVTRTYKSGNVWEKIKYWVPGKRPSKVGRVVRSEINKQEQNETQTIRAAARVLNENFKPGDIILGLDYSDKGLQRVMQNIANAEFMDDEEKALNIYETASHEMRLFLRRVKRECDRRGIEFKYGIAITSDMDGKTGERVRVHHHMVINKESLGVALEKWSLGGVSYKAMETQPDYTPIAEYFIRQTRKIKDAKKFVCSRNLVRPVPKDRIVPSNAEIRVPADGVLLHRSEFKPGRPQYIRYLKLQKETDIESDDVCTSLPKRKRKTS